MHRLTLRDEPATAGDSGLSLADYDVLAALSEPARPGTMTEPRAWIGWELSRLSHHTRANGNARPGQPRNLDDGPPGHRRRAHRGRGRDPSQAASADHVALVKRLFFAPLSPELLQSLRQALESVHDNITLEDRPSTSQ